MDKPVWKTTMTEVVVEHHQAPTQD